MRTFLLGVVVIVGGIALSAVTLAVDSFRRFDTGRFNE